ncbi:MAG: TraR/DksA family transcriptional regulator [Gemmatimonadales bacterium]
MMTRARLLTRRQLGLLEATLSSERDRLERLTETDGGMDAWMTTGDAVATLVEREVGTAVQARAHTRYAAIVDALERLATGTYGTCVDCGRPIPFGRLIAMPEVLQCITCAPPA